MRSFLKDLGIEITEPIAIRTDASAAIGIANRVGIGKVRHIEVNQLWLQEKVYQGEITIHKVKGEENIADALTKNVERKTLEEHIRLAGVEIRIDRHPLAPVVEAEFEEEIEE